MEISANSGAEQTDRRKWLEDASEKNCKRSGLIEGINLQKKSNTVRNPPCKIIEREVFRK